MNHSRRIAYGSSTPSSTPHWNQMSRTARSAPAIAVAICVLASLFGGQTSSSSSSASTARARLSDSVSIQAAGRGRPWINMTDGHELLAAYKGSEEAVRAMSRAQERPLSLASADFDEDRVPDLICGYAGSQGGVMTLHRGNIDSILPNTPDARQRKANGVFSDVPFVSPANMFEIASVPDLLVAGDFNADGHADLIAASRGDVTMHFLAGDGHGSFEAAQAISLPGRITALTSGEINRADGLTDIVAAVDTGDGPKVMVFEGPEGALKATPEVLSLPGAATALVLGYLDNDYAGDLAVAAGNQLLTVHGRDRKLSLDEEAKASVPEAFISSRSFESSVMSVAIGDFTGDSNLDLAVLLEDGSVQMLSQQGRQSAGVKAMRRGNNWGEKTLARGLHTQGGSLFCARVSSLAHENLLMVERENKQLHVWMDDADRQSRGDVTLESRSGEPSAPVTFEIGDEPEAVLPMRLNNDALSDLVVLSAGRMAPSLMHTLANTPIVVCNLMDCTGCGSFRDAVAFANSSPGLDTIRFSNQFSGVPTINLTGPLTITEAITIDGAATGSCGEALEADVHPEALNGMGLDGSNATSGALIIAQGGSDIVNFVVNRFTSSALQITTNGGNIIEGNFLGIASDGTTSRGNGTGLRITSHNNLVGGAAHNVISANTNGVVVDGGSGTDNALQNNLIGTTASGQSVLANTQFGVSLTNGATRNTIGGAFVGAANEIAGSGLDGVLINSANGNNVQRNQFDVNGRNGVSIVSSVGTLVGGTNDIVRNNFFKSNSNGVEINGSASTDNLVQGNFIGVIFDVNGAAINFGNGQNGVSFTGGASRNTVGGSTIGASNLISLNHADGVLVASGNQNKILFNRIYNNLGIPIRLQNGANENQIPPVLLSATLGGNQPTISAVTASDLTVTLNLTGTANQSYTIDFVLYSLCECATGGQTTCALPFPLGQKTATMNGSGSFTGSFTFSVPPPDNIATFGFVNATATSPAGSTSPFAAQCAQIGAATNCTPICPASPAAVQATSASGAVVSYPAATLPANCTGVNVTCAPASGATFPVGTTTVTCTASDASGTRGTCSFTVTVTSQSSCTPVCPATPAPVQATSASGAVVSYPAATLPANCSGVSVTCAPASGATFPVGTTTVTCTASDASGPRGSCAFTITVTPQPAGPVITSACKGDGKQLIINGSGFVDGAKVLINGEVEKKTRFISSTQVIAFKAGKRTFTGDVLSVRNPGNVVTPGFPYTRVDCQ